MLTGEGTNINFIVFGLIRPEFEPTIYPTQGEHANHYATNAVISKFEAIVIVYQQTIVIPIGCNLYVSLLKDLF